MDRKGASSLPFIGAMNDGMDFMRKLWGASGLPGLPSANGITQFAQGLPQALPSMITPTLDVEELDKRIADLRAVEQWLALNANMLRTTIQSLEVQRNTIATLKNFGGQMLSTMGVGAERAAPPAANPYLRPRPPEPPRPAPVVPVPSPAPAAAAPRTPARARPRKKAAAAAVTPTMPLNPALWWGALHDQFSKVASAAAAAGDTPTPKPARPATAPAVAKSAGTGTPRRATRKRGPTPDGNG